MIELHNLQKRYKKKLALQIESLSINRGDCLGLVGNNGAGKTTMLRLILDLIEATQGYVTSKSTVVSKSDEWKSYTGAFLDAGFLVPFLTPIEYLEFIGSLHQQNSEDVKLFIQENAAFYTDNINEKKYIRELSAGNRNKIGIMSALLPKPELVLLDEPFANLDPSSQMWLKTKIKDIHQEGTTLVVSSHDLNHITDVCNRIILIENGKVIKDINTNDDTLLELENYFK